MHTTNVRALPSSPPTTTATTALSPIKTVLTVDQKVTQLVHQILGATTDLSMLAASLVNNVAAAAAVTIGPKPFWGVPYHVATDIAGTAATIAQLVTGEPLNAISGAPLPVTYGILNVLAFFDPAKSPAGANDPSITVTAAHPLPIILLNGTTATQGTNWSVGAAVLANAGYKVYSFNYGNTTSDPNFPIQATGDIAKSAQQLSAKVDEVLAATGAPKVILIGHSQGGGILPEYYLNVLGGADKVSQLIGIAPSNHGTDVDGLAYVKDIPVVGSLVFGLINLFGAGWTQQAIGSKLQQEFYSDGDTRPGVLYTTISSTTDWVVTPYTQQALVGPNVTNIVLQDQHPGLLASHIAIVAAPQTWTAVLGALAANPNAAHSIQDAATLAA